MIDISDTLSRRVKIRAAQEGSSLKTLITRAIERELGSAAEVPVPSVAPKLPVLKSRRPGALRISPDEISELLLREEAAAYAADVRR
jgi:hypothetical protein